MSTLTAETLRARVNYDLHTGLFTHAVSGRGYTTGKVAGTRSERGYVLVRVNYIQYRAHRLAWLHVTGEWPSGEVDHINGRRDDNRWLNLRVVTRMENAHNQRRAHARNKSGGFLGVVASRGKWRARIRAEGRDIGLGTFNTPEEAHEAYLHAKYMHHPTCPVGV